MKKEVTGRFSMKKVFVIFTPSPGFHLYMYLSTTRTYTDTNMLFPDLHIFLYTQYKIPPISFCEQDVQFMTSYRCYCCCKHRVHNRKLWWNEGRFFFLVLREGFNSLWDNRLWKSCIQRLPRSDETKGKRVVGNKCTSYINFVIMEVLRAYSPIVLKK